MKLILVLSIVAAFPLHAQSAQPNPIPPVDIEFATGDGTPISLPSLAMTQLPVCYSEDSCSAVFALNSQDRRRQIAVYFEVSGRDQAVDPGAIESLSYVQILSSTPTADGIAILIHGGASDSGAGVRLVPKPGTEPDRSGLKGGYYVCFFDQHGKLQSVHMLDSRYKPAKIAYFGNDQVVLLLFDTINEKPALTIMNADGQIVRMLDDQSSLPNGSDLQKGSGIKVDGGAPEFFKQAAMVGALSGWQFGYAAKHLLLLQPGADPIIWSISPSGEIRKVRLEMPSGTTAQSIVSSDRAWLIRSSALPADMGLLLEFEPESGKVLRHIDTKVVPPSSIMFAGQGNYYALWWDKDSHPWILKSK